MTEPIDTAAARELADAATPAPWEANGFDVYETQTPHGDVVAEAGLSPADARFIARARELVPAMADEIDRLRSELRLARIGECADTCPARIDSDAASMTGRLNRVRELADALDAEAAEDHESPYYKRWYRADALSPVASRIRRILDDQEADGGE